MASSPDILQHLAIAEALEREATERADLEQQHAVRPDVRHGREEALGQRLGRHPADRQHT